MKLKFKSDKCVACEKCTLVCSLVHNDITSLELGRIKITRNYPSLQDPLIKGYYCRQCKKAKCVAACPQNALVQEDEIVSFNKEKCIGCGKCVEACPFNAIWLDKKKGQSFKCDTCNGNPYCVQICPHEALIWE